MQVARNALSILAALFAQAAKAAWWCIHVPQIGAPKLRKALRFAKCIANLDKRSTAISFIAGLFAFWAVQAEAQQCYLWQDRDNAGGYTGQVAAVIGSEQALYDQTYDRAHGAISATFTYESTTCVDPPSASSPLTCTNQIYAGNPPNGYLENFGVGLVQASGPACPEYWIMGPPPQMSQVNCKNCVPDPINPGVGNVYSTEEDVKFLGSGAIVFRRFYNSADPNGTELVPGWRHSYTRTINILYEQPESLYPGGGAAVSPQYTTPALACTSGFAAIQGSVSAWAGATASYTNNVCVITKASVTIATVPIQLYPTPTPPPTPVEYDVIRDDGQVLRYTLQGGLINNPPGITIRLVATGSEFTVTDDDDTVEVYSSAGVLQSITSRAGVVQTLAYTNGVWSGVTDSFGNSLTVARNAQGSIASMTINGGGTVIFSYDSEFRLSTVTNLDNTVRTYVYGDSRFVNALTSIIDESNATFSSWGYNAQEQATSTQEAGGAGAATLVYNGNGSVTITDALGAVRTFSYTRIGDINNVISISGSQCPTCQEPAATTYDSSGFVNSRTDYNGNLTCYQNDAIRGLELVRVEGFAPGNNCPSNLSTYTPQSGTLQRKITTGWSSIWREPSLITEANRTTGFTFDGSGNILTKTITDTTVAPNVSRTWTYTYNSFGQVLTAQLPRTDLNSTTTYVYYPCPGTYCGQVETIENALSQTTTFDTYNVYGQPLTITDPNGVLTTLAYDPRERLTSSAVSAGGFATETTGYSYYPTGLLETVTMPDSSTITYNYDGAHRLTDITDGAGNYTSYTLDALGNRTAIDMYDPTSTLDYTQTRAYNTLGQLYQVIGAAGTSAVTTQYGYDSNGNNTSIDAPLTRNTGQQFDVLNRLDKITDPNSGVTNFTYDAEDDLTKVTDPKTLATNYTYSGFSQVLTTVLRSMGPGALTNTYDSFGNLATYTDARSDIATYAYDALNRVTSAAFSKSGTTEQTINYTYDSGTNGKGRLTGASDSKHSMSWVYDAKGRVTSKAQTVGTVARTVGYAYTNGDMVKLTTPSGQAITYTYADHQITSIVVNSTTLLSSVSYEPFGPPRGWTWGNGTAETRLYNTDGNPSQMAGPESHSYTYDNAFRIQQISDASNSALTWTYGYDPLDRLTSASDTGTTQGFTYDADGNRLTQTGTVSGTYTVPTTNNRLTAITGTPARTYTFDTDGDDLSYSTITLVFNDRDRMSTATVGSITTSYLYNALGQRVKKSGGPAGTVFFVYDEAGHLEGEYSSSGALVEETVWLGDTPVATLQPVTGGVGIYYIHADHLNAPHMITRATDNGIMWRWDNDPFGAAAPNQNPTGLGTFVYNPRFPGQYYDVETGLFYNYFRDYDPQTGRYVESDPIGLDGGSYSTYAYTGGNPVSRRDPFGLAWCDVADMVALARANNPDLDIPIPTLWEIPNTDSGAVVAGQTGQWPWSMPEVNSALYGGKLNSAQRIDLYNTIVHESWHYDKQPFYDRSSVARENEAYAQADARAARDANQIRHGKNSCGCGQ